MTFRIHPMQQHYALTPYIGRISNW